MSKTVLFQTIKFYISTVFVYTLKCKNGSISNKSV